MKFDDPVPAFRHLPKTAYGTPLKRVAAVTTAASRTPVPAAEGLFTVEQLEEWKDRIAEWWGKERLRYDHKQTAELLRKWFGVSRKEAVEMEFNSRDDPDKFIERFLNSLVGRFRAKLRKRKRVVGLDVSMSFRHGAFATTEFPAGSGQEFQHDVPGHAGIVGRVYYQDGTKQTMFQRFVSHPFWQHSHQTTPPAQSK